MTKSKYTIEIAKNIIEQDGNKLISTEYKNDKIPLEVQCGKCDNKYSVAFQSYKRGTRCKKCSDIERGKRKKNIYR
jgi:ribosomal protein S27E